VDEVKINVVTSKICSSVKDCFNSEKGKSSMEIGREDIDEAQIIYSYLKGSGNNGKHITIPATWIKTQVNDKLKKAVEEMVIDRFSEATAEQSE
jgi:excinuclease ABC subunit C